MHFYAGKPCFSLNYATVQQTFVYFFLIYANISSSSQLYLFLYSRLGDMYSGKNVAERVGDAEHEYGAVRFLRSSIPQLQISPYSLISTWSPPTSNGCSMDAERVLNGCLSQPEHPFITLFIRFLLYRSPLFQRHTHFVPYVVAQTSVSRLTPFLRPPQCLVILRLPYSPSLRIM